jgi:uncharacterized protein YidB (DUF937 family)
MSLLNAVVGAVGSAMSGGQQAGAGGLGGLGALAGLLGGGQGGGGNAALLQAALGMLGNDSQGGGLGGLVGKFQQAGLGNQMSSWIGSGQNLPISPDQLQSALGGDMLGQLAKQVGMSPADTGSQLSQMLPEVINHLTPSGSMPAGGLGSVADLLGMLTKR